MLIQDIRAIVTGAASGLGYHFAMQLAAAGAQVVAGDIDRAGLRQLAARARDLPGAVHPDVLDIADERSVERFVLQAFHLQEPNTLINNAGILLDGLLLKRESEGVRKLPVLQWSKVIEVNLTGQFLMMREVCARMVEADRKGVVVNISSLARSGNPGQSNYSASKAGLDAATRTWALELAAYGIRVGGVAAGLVQTPMIEKVDPSRLDAMIASIPLGRVGQPEDIWQAVRFILECEFFTGRVIEVDGGASMG
ncbi:MAG: 3-oxoacyl-[acyl-carrier protein] reductase [Acidobacteriota bacterium]|jgi:3-oxoacyl-[acyl-carrier protein] reductase|nr:3-oxoacyl-[acyl-carrier protein] reductase [Acidobacteriota bacterium]